MSLLKRIEAQGHGQTAGQLSAQDHSGAARFDPYLVLRGRIHRRIIDGMNNE